MIYPKEFEKYRQFILHKNKMPINPHTLQPFGKGSDWQNDKMCWTDGFTASQLVKVAGPDYGLGFLFTPQDPFFFVDIDKCLTDGQWSDVAKNVLAMFPGCAVEVSSSGTGLHIFGTGKPSTEHACKNTQLGLEFYTQHRFVALTGTHASGDAATVCSPDLFVAEYMPRDKSPEAVGWTTEAVEGYQHLDDEELIKKACRSGGVASVFGERATFGDLWHSNTRMLARAYPPSTQGSDFDHSSADAALAQHLAFWTGRNCERVRHLMFKSNLVRPKWERDDYMVRTIEGAVARQVEFYTGPDRRRREQLLENIEIGEHEEEEPFTPILSLDQMLKELVFIGGEHAVGHIPSKKLRKKAAAADEYAASYHTFIDPDTRAEKVTPAFKSWLSQKSRLSVECATWWPGEPDICRAPENTGLAFNTWKGLVGHPHVPTNWVERAQPFVDHVAWLCGDETDNFLKWMGHILQKPAELPHTCYLHVTPTTGIGRNWVAGVLCRAIRGYVAAGVDISKVLDGGFNGRLSRKLLAIVDEVREGGDYGKRVIRGEKLKSIVNEETREIDPKYGVMTIERNCCRWLMFSQHMDALPFENNDRRVIVVANPTQRKPSEYYGHLYGLLKDPLFIASVYQYLLSIDLHDFCPSTPAPLNSAKLHALEAMASEVDLAMAEFKNSWPADIATFDQIKEYCGTEKDAHIRHAIARAGMVCLGSRVKMPNGKRTRLVVVRGNRNSVEARGNSVLRDQAAEAEVGFKFE